MDGLQNVFAITGVLLVTGRPKIYFFKIPLFGMEKNIF